MGGEKRLNGTSCSGFHWEEKRLLGVHTIGTGATELIHIGQAVLALGGGIHYFLQTVFNDYPTGADCYKVAAPQYPLLGEANRPTFRR